VYSDLHDKTRRASNFIVSGLPPRSGVTDKAQVAELVSTDVGLQINIKSCRRLGKMLPNKIQQLLITVRDPSEAESVVGAAKGLRSSEDPYVRDHVFINADLTPAESKALYDERCRRRALATQQKTTSKQGNQPDTSANVNAVASSL
jgi:hypothetical protein